MDSEIDASSSLNARAGAPKYNLEKLSKISRNSSTTSNRFTIVGKDLIFNCFH